MMTTLRLTVISAPADSPLTGQNLDVSVAGSTLGRGTTNAIVLPDHERIVSTRHASIRHELGQFIITDHSTNGTFLNDSPMPLGPEKSVPLQNGDVVIVGKYRLQVSLVQPAAAAPVSSDAGFLDDLGVPAAPAPASARRNDQIRISRPATGNIKAASAQIPASSVKVRICPMRRISWGAMSVPPRKPAE